MVPLPYAERRHRIHGAELTPVKEAVHTELLRRLETRDDILTTATLFRFWYRIETHCTNKPSYPDHDTWEALESYMGYGTEMQPLEAAPIIKEASD